MQLPQLKPVLGGTAGGEANGALTQSSATALYGCTDISRVMERGGDSRATQEGYSVASQLREDMSVTTRHGSPCEMQLCAPKLQAQASPLPSLTPPLEFPRASTYSPCADGGAAAYSASVPLSATHAGGFDHREISDCPLHQNNGDSWWWCGCSSAARGGEQNGIVLSREDGCWSGCGERFSIRGVSAALLSTTAQTSPGYLLALIGLVTGVLLFLPWSRNPVHVLLIVLSPVVGCVCGFMYFFAERRWERRLRRGCGDANCASLAYSTTVLVSGGHVPSVPESAVRAGYHDHDTEAEGEKSGGCCGGCFNGYRAFGVALPTVQLLLLGTFVLVSPQVMATWSIPTADENGGGGGGIIDNREGQWGARYGAKLYPVEVVWKACLLHAWIGMGFALPVACTLSVGLVHMAVLLAQHRYAAPGTLLTLVVWMSLPLLCCVFSILIASPRPAIREGQRQRQRLRDLTVRGVAVGDHTPRYGAGVGAALPFMTRPFIGRGHGFLDPTQASISYPEPSVESPAAPARGMQHGASPSPSIVPPPPVDVYLTASHARSSSAHGTGGHHLGGHGLDGYASLAPADGINMGMASYSHAHYAYPSAALTSRYESNSLLVSLRRRPVRSPYPVEVGAVAASAQRAALRSGPTAYPSGKEAFPEGPIGLGGRQSVSLWQQRGHARSASASSFSPYSAPPTAHEGRHQSSQVLSMDAVNGAGDGAQSSSLPPPASHQPPQHRRLSIGSARDQSRGLEHSERLPQLTPQRRSLRETLAGGAEEDSVFSEGAAVHGDDGAVVVVVPPDLPQRRRQKGEGGSLFGSMQRAEDGGAAAAVDRAAAVTASAVGDRGRASGGGGPGVLFSGCGGDELQIPSGTSLEEALTPYFVLDAALVIVDVNVLLCQLLGTTVDAILFRRLPDILTWLDVIERETVMKLLSALAQSQRTASAAMQGHSGEPRARRAKKGSVKAKPQKSAEDSKANHRGAQRAASPEGGRTGFGSYDPRSDRSAQTKGTAQFNKSSGNEPGVSVAEGVPVQRITLRGHCPYYTLGNDTTSGGRAGRGGCRPSFALCFDVWAERLVVPSVSGLDGSARRSNSSVVMGNSQQFSPFVIIFRRPLLHGLCDALPLPVALVHPRTGEVLAWSRYAARLTGCASYDMLGTSVYSSFVCEGSPEAASMTEDQGALSSTGPHSPLPPPPPPPSSPQLMPIVNSMSSAHQPQRPSDMAALSATARTAAVPSGEGVSSAFSSLSAKTTLASAAATLQSAQPMTTSAVYPSHGAQLLPQRGRAGSPSFFDQASLSSNAADLSGTPTTGALRQCRDIPLPGFFFVSSTRSAAAMAGVDPTSGKLCRPSVIERANERGDAGPSHFRRTGTGVGEAALVQLPWTSTGRGSAGVATSEHADRLASHFTTLCRSPTFPGGDVGQDAAGSGGKSKVSNAATGPADVHCPRSLLSPPPLSGEGQRGTDIYNDGATASTSAFEADRHQQVLGDDGNDGDDAMRLPNSTAPIIVRGLLFRATLRPLRGVLCSEEGGVIENQLGGPLQTTANTLDGEDGWVSSWEECTLQGHPLGVRPKGTSAPVEADGLREGRERALEHGRHDGGDVDSGSDDGGEAALTDERRGGRHYQRQHVVGRMAATARLRGSEYRGDSGAEDGSGMDGDVDDGTRYDEGNPLKSMQATASSGLTLAATLEQLFDAKAMLSRLCSEGELSEATPAAAESRALLSTELAPRYSLRAALEQLAASEAPLLLTLSEPPLYATACPDVRSLLQERWLIHRSGGSVFQDDRGYLGATTHAGHGGGYGSVPERNLGTPLRPFPFVHRQRPQLPALWGDGSTSLQYVAAIRDVVESYRGSVEEDASGYTDFLGLLSLCSGDDGENAISSSAAINLSSSLMRPAEGGSPDVAVAATITPGASRQLLLLKAFSDHLLQATATYNRSRESKIPSSRRHSGGVAGPISTSTSTPSFILGVYPASSQPDADASHVYDHYVRNTDTAPALPPPVDAPASELYGGAPHQSLIQFPLPPPNLIVTDEVLRGARQRQSGDAAMGANAGCSGGHTRIYRDPNFVSLSATSEDFAGASATAVGTNHNLAGKELPPPPIRAAVRTATTAAGGMHDTADRQDDILSQVKSFPHHATKSSAASAPLSPREASRASARHSGQGGSGGAVSTSVPTAALARSDSALAMALEPHSFRGIGEIHGSAPIEVVPRDVAGEGSTVATPHAAMAFSASSSTAAAAAATGSGVSALDVETPHTVLHSPLPRGDPTVVCGDGAASSLGGGASGEVAGAVGVSSHSPTSPLHAHRLLSPSLAAAERVELEEGSHSGNARPHRSQRQRSPNKRSGRGGDKGAARAQREPASPRGRASVPYIRESSLNILQSQPGCNGSLSVHRGLIPTSNSGSPPALAGAGGHETDSASPPPARPVSSSLNANHTPAAATSAGAPVRSTPQRFGDGAVVWAVLVSRDETTIPSCLISVPLGDEFRLGRSSKCTAVVSDSFVSSTQFSIVRTVSASTTAPDLQSPGSGRGERGTRRGKALTVTLYDRSANGTYVNVKKLGKDKSCVLRDKALITFRLSTSQFFLGFVFMLTDERGVPLDDRMGISGGSGLHSLLDARLSPRPLTGRRGNATTAGASGGGGKESGGPQGTLMASPNAPSASAARRNTPRALSTPDNWSFASGTPNGSRRAGGGHSGASRSGRHAHRETIEWKIGEEMLGKGGNAEVFLGINLTNGQLIAVKRVRLPTVAHGSDAEQDPEAKAILQQYRSLQEEINVLSKATHPNIVQYYGSSQNSTYFNILLEFVPGGSLRHLLDNFGALSPGVILSYLHQALEGLAYLHRHNIVHSDFKAANILITEKGKVKLTDFGTARLLNRQHTTAAAAAAAAAARGGGEAPSMTSRGTSAQRNDDAASVGIGGTLHIAGTLRWMDPALFHNSHTTRPADSAAAAAAIDSLVNIGGPTKAGDIWSVGCTMIEMMSGEAPWFEYEFDSEEQIVNLLTYTADPPEIPECPECPDLVAIAQTCLRMDVSRRPTCEELLRIVEEATVRLQAQSVSPSASPSREISQQPPPQQFVALNALQGAGDASGHALSSTTELGPDMEPGPGSSSISFVADPSVALGAVADDRRQGDRLFRPTDFTSASLAVGGEGDGGTSAATTLRDTASSAFLSRTHGDHE